MNTVDKGNGAKPVGNTPVYGNSKTQRWVYDSNNRLSASFDLSGAETRYTYDLRGLPERRQNPSVMVIVHHR